MDRRRFLGTLGGAGIACLAPSALLARGADGVVIAVVDADQGSAYGRGAILGIEEGERAAALLRSPLRFARYQSPGVADTAALARRLAGEGAAGIVSALPGRIQRSLEGAAVSEGLVLLDARPAPPVGMYGADRGQEREPPAAGGVFRTGVPSAAYGLALLEALVSAHPAWRWEVVVEEGAPEARVRDVRQRLGEAAGDANAAGPQGQVDARVRIGRGTRAGDQDDGGIPTVLIDPATPGPPQPVEGFRATLWDAALFRYGAEQLNERYRRRFGEGMDGAAWSAWMAVKALTEATLRTPPGAGVEAGLAGPRAAFDGHKGAPLTFDGPGGTLAQPLYVVGQGETREVEWPGTERDG